MLRYLIYSFLFLFIVTGCKEVSDCEDRYGNPFNNAFLLDEPFNEKCFNLEDDGDEISHFTYEEGSCSVKVDVKFNSEKGQDFNIYGVSFYIQNLPLMDSVTIDTKLKAYDVDIVSNFIQSGDTMFYFFAKHRYNNLIFKCYGNTDKKQVEIALKVPVLDRKELKERKEKYLQAMGSISSVKD